MVDSAASPAGACGRGYAAGASAWMSQALEKFDHLLDSKGLDRPWPLLDPHGAIAERFPVGRAKRLGLTVEEVQPPYETQATR